MKFHALLLFLILTGCAKSQTSINLGGNLIGTKTYYLSQMGIMSDASLANGSTTFGADQTYAIQAVLNNAQTSPILIYWDVKASVTGLTIYSNTQIVASPSNGAILRNNSNKALMQNAHLSFTTLTDSNITIEGGTWNGNGANSSLNPAQATPVIGAGWTVGFRFYGVRKLKVQNAIIYNTRTFAFHLIRTQDATFTNNIIQQNDLLTTRTDGIHLDGTNERVLIDGLIFHGKDDAIALITEGNLEPTNDNYYSNAVGAMTDIQVRNVILNNSLAGIRLLSQSHRLDRISFSNISGTTTYRWLVANNGYSSQPGYQNKGNVGTISFDDIDVRVSVPLDSGDVTIGFSADQIRFTRIFRRSRNASSPFQPTIMVKGNVTVKNLTLDNYMSYDSVGVSQSPHILIADSATVTNLAVSDIALSQVTTSSNQHAFIDITSKGTVNFLRINGLTADRIYWLVRNAGTVGNITAANIIHTNGSSSFKTTPTISQITLSNISGGTDKTEGTFTHKYGDAF